ncbi:uncharacterized protein PFL1_04298 [Pseudozyma flocculosa PF-1]|uniref:C2H2-type domain-containing protein n=2 Tax=Pseudozyma flocculosa TaxID=84751 RepID=A0A5C3FDT8_9BASI|nr:uncharacterized protein PFL1_04298 [Pseudozyma flocculosa PF-1]EPQ27971.1 hypothetical protein PFL1_04298 [Pseudozyma flocculosa PF-1]SPO41641.1 uncharacterized protein PSFLO_07123 [Pseudozyma flocculosa]
MYENRPSSPRSWSNDGLRQTTTVSEPSKSPNGLAQATDVGHRPEPGSLLGVSNGRLDASSHTANSATPVDANPEQTGRPLGTSTGAVRRDPVVQLHSYPAPPLHHQPPQPRADALAASTTDSSRQGSSFHPLTTSTDSIRHAVPLTHQIVYNDGSSTGSRHPQLMPISQVQRPTMNVIYQNHAYGGPSANENDMPYRYGGAGSSGAGSGNVDLSATTGQVDDDDDDDKVHFWPVPRLVQGLTEASYPTINVSDARISGLPDFFSSTPAGMAGQAHAASDPYAGQVPGAVAGSSSYTYHTPSPSMQDPGVFGAGQASGFGGLAGSWSTSSTPTTEYPTAPYALQSRRLLQDNDDFGSQRYAPHEAAYSERGDDDSGRSATSHAGAGVANNNMGVPADVTGFFDHTDAALWPLGPSQLAAVSRPPDFPTQSMFGMAMPLNASPDRDRFRSGKPGPPSLPLPKQFKCSACDAIFSRNHDLKRHARIHLAVKPFPCMFCDKAFSRKDALKRHVLVKGCGVGNRKNGDKRKRSQAAAGAASDKAQPPNPAPPTALEGIEDASPDSSFGSQQHFGDVGGVAMEATPSFEEGGPGRVAAWREPGSGAGPPGPFDSAGHPASFGAAGEVMLGGGFKTSAPQGVDDVRLGRPPFPGDPHMMGGSEPRFDGIPGHAALMQSNSLAKAYPPDMGASGGAPSRRAYGMPGASAGYVDELAAGARQASRPQQSNGFAAGADHRGGMMMPSSDPHPSDHAFGDPLAHQPGELATAGPGFNGPAYAQQQGEALGYYHHQPPPGNGDDHLAVQSHPAQRGPQPHPGAGAGVEFRPYP